MTQVVSVKTTTQKQRRPPDRSQLTIVVDLQAGRRLVLNLWESEEYSAAALSVLGREVGRLLEPLMSHPSEVPSP